MCSSDLADKIITGLSNAQTITQSHLEIELNPISNAGATITDRKSVVLGKSVDLGGRRIIKKKKKRGNF